MRVAQRCLRIGGRLVFFLAVPLVDFDESQLPHADGMRVICWEMQQLSLKHGRRLICYVKEREGSGEVAYLRDDICFDDMRNVVGLADKRNAE